MRRAALATAATLGRAVCRAVPYVWAASGLALLSAAAWTIATPAGLAAAGLSCLIMEWRVRGT